MDIEFRLRVTIDRDAYNREYGDDSESNDEVVDYIRESIAGRIRDLQDVFSYYSVINFKVTES